MIITRANALKILRNANIDIADAIENAPEVMDLFTLGHMIGALILISTNDNFFGDYGQLPELESELSDGIHTGLNRFAENYGTETKPLHDWDGFRVH